MRLQEQTEYMPGFLLVMRLDLQPGIRSLQLRIRVVCGSISNFEQRSSLIADVAEKLTVFRVHYCRLMNTDSPSVLSCRIRACR